MHLLHEPGRTFSRKTLNTPSGWSRCSKLANFQHSSTRAQEYIIPRQESIALWAWPATLSTMRLGLVKNWCVNWQTMWSTWRSIPDNCVGHRWRWFIHDSEGNFDSWTKTEIMSWITQLGMSWREVLDWSRCTFCLFPTMVRHMQLLNQILVHETWVLRKNAYFLKYPFRVGGGRAPTLECFPAAHTDVG